MNVSTSKKKVRLNSGDSVWTKLLDAGWSERDIVDKGLVSKVASLNGLEDPDLVDVNQELVIPVRGSATKSAPKSPPPPQRVPSVTAAYAPSIRPKVILETPPPPPRPSVSFSSKPDLTGVSATPRPFFMPSHPPFTGPVPPPTSPRPAAPPPAPPAYSGPVAGREAALIAARRRELFGDEVTGGPRERLLLPQDEIDGRNMAARESLLADRMESDPVFAAQERQRWAAEREALDRFNASPYGRARNALADLYSRGKGAYQDLSLNLDRGFNRLGDMAMARPARPGTWSPRKGMAQR